MNCRSLFLPILSFTFLAFCLVGVGHAQTFHNLQKPAQGTWFLDRTGRIDQAAAKAINDLCQEVADKHSGEIFVVVTDTTNGRAHRQFATNLFNTWGIASRWKNNGILVFAALNDRRSEIILGTGVETDRDVDHAEVITDHFLIPSFRRGDYGNGCYSAARACAARIFGLGDLVSSVDLPPLSERNATNRSAANSSRSNRNHTDGARNESSSNATSPERTPPVNESVPRNAAPINNFEPANNAPVHRREFDRHRGMDFNPFPWVLGITVVICIVLFFVLRYYWRYRKRKCDECGEDLVMLTESQDDQFLSEPEILEEKLGSVDYDVWACFHCEYVDKFRYGTFFTRYSKCPHCQYRTKTEISETLVVATENHGGKVRVCEWCEYCDFQNTYTYATPRIEKSDDSNSSSRSRSRSRSRSSSSGGFGGFGGFGGGGGGGGGSSSSSSRGSGGQSSGRGASGSW